MIVPSVHKKNDRRKAHRFDADQELFTSPDDSDPSGFTQAVDVICVFPGEL